MRRHVGYSISFEALDLNHLVKYEECRTAQHGGRPEHHVLLIPADNISTKYLGRYVDLGGPKSETVHRGLPRPYLRLESWVKSIDIVHIDVGVVGHVCLHVPC